MKITATIVNPFDIENIIREETELIDIAVAGNYVSINNQLYRVGHTLFRYLENTFTYSFEQKIKRMNKNSEPDTKEYFLILGKIKFDANDILDNIFKDAKIRVTEEFGYNTIDETIRVPYNYMRVYDFIEVKSKFYICEKIVVSENLEIRVNLFQSPRSLSEFREDKNGFLLHNLTH